MSDPATERQIIWGFCKACDRSVVIEPRGYKPDGDGRQREWFPIEHDTEGKRCPGVTRPV